MRCCSFHAACCLIWTQPTGCWLPGLPPGRSSACSCSCCQRNPGNNPFPNRTVGIRRAGAGRQLVRPVAHRLLWPGLFPHPRRRMERDSPGPPFGGSSLNWNWAAHRQEEMKAWRRHFRHSGNFPRPDPGLFCLFSPFRDFPLDRGQLHLDRARRQPAGSRLGFTGTAPPAHPPDN